MKMYLRPRKVVRVTRRQIVEAEECDEIQTPKFMPKNLKIKTFKLDKMKKINGNRMKDILSIKEKNVCTIENSPKSRLEILESFGALGKCNTNFTSVNNSKKSLHVVG